MSFAWVYLFTPFNYTTTAVYCMSITWVYLFKPFNYTMWNYSSLLHRFCMGVFIHTFQLYHLQQFTACHLYACIYLNLSIIQCGITAVFCMSLAWVYLCKPFNYTMWTHSSLHGCIYANLSIIPCGLTAVYCMSFAWVYLFKHFNYTMWTCSSLQNGHAFSL